MTKMYCLNHTKDMLWNWPMPLHYQVTLVHLKQLVSNNVVRSVRCIMHNSVVVEVPVWTRRVQTYII